MRAGKIESNKKGTEKKRRCPRPHMHYHAFHLAVCFVHVRLLLPLFVVVEHPSSADDRRATAPTMKLAKNLVRLVDGIRRGLQWPEIGTACQMQMNESVL